MKSLILKKSGLLFETKYDPNTQTYIESDVTESAIRYLFESCTLAPDLTLRDIFLLLNSNLEMFDLILGNWCKEYVAEALSEPEAPPPSYDPDAIEYLELYKNLWADKDEVLGLTHPDFHGVGFELKEDRLFPWGDIEWEKGSRIPWALNFMNTKKLVNLPIRIRSELQVFNQDPDSAQFGEILATYPVPVLSLGEILHGILWELSFHGSPQMRDEESLELRKVVDDIKSGKEQGIPIGELFSSDDPATDHDPES